MPLESSHMIEFDAEVCGDLQQASSREWLETNGLGGFASSTITGLNTRRYHGLLIAATNPPVGRTLLLSKLEEALIIGNERIELATNQYPCAVHPSGFLHLKRFRLDPYPIFTFGTSGTIIEKHVCMLHGENSTVVEYRLISSSQKTVRLHVRPLIAFRDYHALTHKNDVLNRKVIQSAGLASVAPYSGLPTLHVAHNAKNVTTDADWYYSFQYVREQERGLDFIEDLFNPLCCEFDLSADQPASLIASTELRSSSEASQLIRAEVERRRAISASNTDSANLRGQLALAADQFIVRRGAHKTIIAGYHWFGDWGRDTMISLPGLLALGRAKDIKDILLEFSNHVDQGMLPNRFTEHGETPEYNTVDATLWYFEAVRAYHEATGEDPLLKKLYPILVDIIDWHVRGTRYDIFMDSDGLLHSGPQLTWMDAKVEDWIVTPRSGKAVEIQALWYNALRISEHFAARLGDAPRREQNAELARKVTESFNIKFWNDTDGCLFDVIGDSNDTSLRPNQIFAVSLFHTMLKADRARAVVDKVQKELLTPFGLRTLSATDPNYAGHYRGDQRSRDAAYHQGTVWPWLMGAFVQAYIKVNGNNASARALIWNWLAELQDSVLMAGLGTISEIFEGDPPHTPCGCIAQAWSVSELIRCLDMCEGRDQSERP